MDSPFLTYFAEGLAARRFRVVRFEFPYMAKRRSDGVKRPPDKAMVLTNTWRAVISELGAERLVIAGKSMGCRIASLVADDAQVAGLLCLGFPFHATGRPQKRQCGHLSGLRTPTLILQGDRDPFGTRAEVEGYTLSPAIRLHWLRDGEHSFKPRKSSGRTVDDNLFEALEFFAEFVTDVTSAKI